MSKPFFKRLQKYYSSVGDALREESGAASIFPNKTDIGISRERLYADFLRQHIPSNCNVLFGGFLFDQDGNESKQIDVLVIGGDVLQFNFNSKEGKGKSFACIDGCIAAVGIKSNLNSPELIDSLENLSSLPQKRKIKNSLDRQPNSKEQNFDFDAFQVMPFLKIDCEFYKDWPLKIIYASKGIGIENAINTLDKFYKDNPDIPYWKRPNLIHVAGRYVIARVPSIGGEDLTGKKLKAHSFHAMPEVSDAYGLLQVVIRIQDIASLSNYIFYKYSGILKNMKFKQNRD